MSRRQGTIRERSPGSYELRYSLGRDAVTGKRKTAAVTYKAKTKKDAERELRRLLAAVDDGSHVDPSRLTVREWLIGQWLGYVKAEVGPATYDKYEDIVTRRLLPQFGNVPMSKLTANTIQAAISEWTQEGLSAATVRLAYRVLHTALARAVELQIVARNPAAVLRRRLPKGERAEMATLFPEQVQLLLNEVRGSDLYWPVMLSLATGMRRGEVLALKWGAVDLDKGTVLIREARVRLRRGTATRPPKSGKARMVTLPAYAVDELRERRLEQAEQLLRLGVRVGPDTYVCARADGSPMGLDRVSNDFLTVTRRLGLNVHFHSLRHSHATALLLAGVHPKVAQERLGHASIRMTMDVYSHVVERLNDDAADKINAVFGGRNA